MYKYFSILVVISICNYMKGSHCQNCNTQFVLAADSDYFPPENVSNTISVPDASVCTASCYRFKQCIAVSFDQTSDLCTMFTSYKTLTNRSNETSRAVFFTLESLCGPSEMSVPMENWRDDVISTSQVTCNETTVFLGSHDTSVCAPPSRKWSPATVACVDNVMPLMLSGAFLRVVDSKVTIVGIPTGDSFYITFIEEKDDDYLLKILVNMTSNTIYRYSRIGGDWNKAPDLSGVPFPFFLDKTFTMEVVSHVTEFECKVNEQEVFTFNHQLPRDSVDKIRISSFVHLMKVLTT